MGTFTSYKTQEDRSYMGTFWYQIEAFFFKNVLTVIVRAEFPPDIFFHGFFSRVTENTCVQCHMEYRRDRGKDFHPYL